MKVTLEFADEFDNSEKDLTKALHIEDGKTAASAASAFAAFMAGETRAECADCLLRDETLTNNEKILALITVERMITKCMAGGGRMRTITIDLDLFDVEAKRTRDAFGCQQEIFPITLKLYAESGTVSELVGKILDSPNMTDNEKFAALLAAF